MPRNAAPMVNALGVIADFPWTTWGCVVVLPQLKTVKHTKALQVDAHNAFLEVYYSMVFASN